MSSFIDCIRNAANVYIFVPKKASFLNLQARHHHGREGIDRANLLINVMERFKDYPEKDGWIEQFISDYLKKKVPTGDRLYRNLKLSISITPSEALLLNGGNDHRGSLRTMVRVANESYQRFLDLMQTSVCLDVLTQPDLSPLPANVPDLLTYLEPTAEPRNPRDNACAVKIQFEGDSQYELVGSLNVSAHPIHRYKHSVTGRSFFMKEQGQMELADLVAEVAYSKLWRTFLGERISSSLIVTNAEGQPAGICSVGLVDFIEYKSILREPDFRPEAQFKSHSSLIPIFLLSYLLLENDLHVKNYGVTTLSSGERVFGKIDHDYIVAKWKDNGKSFTRQLPLDWVLPAILDQSQLMGIGLLMERFRFSPGTENQALLRLGHTLRGETKKATLNKESTKPFRKETTVKYESLLELERIKSLFLNYSTQQLFAETSAAIEAMKALGWPVDKAKEIMAVIQARVELLQKILKDPKLLRKL